MREEPGGGTFQRVLDSIAEAGVTADIWPGAYARNDDASHMAEAARIALSLAGRHEPHPSQRRRELHRRFIDTPEDLASPTARADEPLRLPDGLTVAQLEKLRRQFAKLNHPDRAAPGGRDLANERMAIFNRMVDEALAQVKVRPTRSN